MSKESALKALEETIEEVVGQEVAGELLEHVTELRRVIKEEQKWQGKVTCDLEVIFPNHAKQRIPMVPMPGRPQLGEFIEIPVPPELNMPPLLATVTRVRYVQQSEGYHVVISAEISAEDDA